MGQNLVKREDASIKTLPAPVDGWNARDSLADMGEKDAVLLVNWFPQLTYCQVRYGYTQFATGLPGQTETLMEYSGGSTSKFFAIAGGSVYDITSGGAVGAAAVSGLTNSRWQYVNVATPGGTFILMVNGVDAPYLYNGTTWTNPSITGSGLTATNLVNINLHKNRVWFVENGTLKAWYLPIQSISGTAQPFDLSAYADRGGYIMAMGTWTIDSGYGSDDYAVFVTSNGQVLVYRGTDPSSASTWALSGIYWMGSPIGRRCMEKYRGDMVVITQDGLVALSSALEASRLNPKAALTNKIQGQISSAVSTYSGNFGWQVIPYPKQNMLLLNVPVQVGNLQEQYVMNTLSGAWCDFQGWNANCWELFNDDMYFGANGYVGKAWNTNADNGAAITTSGLQAFNDFGTPREKQFTMMRPMLYTNGTPSIQGSINVNFDQSAPGSNLQTLSVPAAIWDSGTWDSALWADTLILSRVWQGATGIGTHGAPRIASSSNGQVLQWVATDIVGRPGGIL